MSHEKISEAELTDNEIIKQLATLTPFQYDRIRIEAADRLHVQLTTLDQAVKTARPKNSQKTSTPFSEIELWHEPINPSDLLNEIANTIQKFIICQPETIHAATLWIAMTWFIDVIQVAPLAMITAPEKRCGKSQLLALLGRLVNRPILASNVTSAALFRTIDTWQPTLLIDEADTFMRENDELRGIINAGHTRESAYTLRLVGDHHQPKQFFVWGAKALAGIGHLPDTLMDRAIVLELRRKLPHEKTERLRHAETTLFKTLSAKLARFAEDYSEQIRTSQPELPDTLNDRAQDNWEPLFAIAEIAGAEWLRLARIAALKLSSDDQSQGASVELLAGIKEIFKSKNLDRISSAELINELCSDQEKHWATYNRGSSISPRQIANRLREFKISSNTIRLGAITAKGYMKSQFEDAFARYLSATVYVNVTPSQANICEDPNATDVLPVTSESVTHNSK